MKSVDSRLLSSSNEKLKYMYLKINSTLINENLITVSTLTHYVMRKKFIRFSNIFGECANAHEVKNVDSHEQCVHME